MTMQSLGIFNRDYIAKNSKIGIFSPKIKKVKKYTRSTIKNLLNLQDTNYLLYFHMLIECIFRFNWL